MYGENHFRSDPRRRDNAPICIVILLPLTKRNLSAGMIGDKEKMRRTQEKFLEAMQDLSR